MKMTVVNLKHRIGNRLVSQSNYEVQVGVSVQNVHPCQAASNISAAGKWRVLVSVLLRMKAVSVSLTMNNLKLYLNKDVLYTTALVMMNMIRGDHLSLLLPNRCVMATLFLIVRINCILCCRLYRLTAYQQFIYWTHSKLSKGIRKVIPSCAVVAIRHKFPELDNT